MEVRNCRECGAMFNYIGGGSRLCPGCRTKLDEKFQEVKKYIEENKLATVAQTSEACEVSQKQITQWIREERLEFGEDSMVTFACDGCGTRIRTGRFCDKCKSDMTRGLMNMYPKEKPTTPQKATKEKERMRFLDS